MKNYSELSKLPTFDERLDYLRLDGRVGEDTFGFDRYLNQVFYKSKEWRKIRAAVLIRDDGCDLGIPGFASPREKLIIHHINPITKEDVLNRNPIIYDLENLITVTKRTHDAIHYGGDPYRQTGPVIRHAGDTKLW